MNGDIERDTFDRLRHYARVVKQQGRVELPADWNEQTDIVLHYIRSLAADLIGPSWGPANAGFAVTAPTGNPADFRIKDGHYYVDGILCECDTPCTYRTQPHYPLVRDDALPAPSYAVYLDVWERPVGYVHDDRIREVALGGPDTATRTQVVWQVKTQHFEGPIGADLATDKTWRDLVAGWQPELRGRLQAQVAPQEISTDPCTTSPKSSYRGAENQLYRVEIHRGGQVALAAGGPPGPTFMWSRDNGSVCFPIRSLAGDAAEVDMLGRDERHTLRVGDWVEVVYDEVILRGTWPAHPGPPPILAQVASIDQPAMMVTLEPRPAGQTLPPYPDPTPRPEPGARVSHPFLRRWDHRARPKSPNVPVLADDGALVLTEGEWLTLEDGVQVKFTPAPKGKPHNVYRPGDYWLIPARTATGDVEWPVETDANGAPVLEDGHPKPARVAPHGVEHHYALLAVVTGNGPEDRRCGFIPGCAKIPV